VYFSHILWSQLFVSFLKEANKNFEAIPTFRSSTFPLLFINELLGCFL